MSKVLLSTTTLIAILGLSACGGGGGSDSSSGGSSSAYTELAQRDVTRTSNIRGNVVITGTTTEIRQIEASLSHNEGNLTGFTDNGGNTLSDTDGDNSGTWTNGTITLQPSDTFSGSYDYSALYNMVVDGGDGGPMIIGVAIASSDVPTTGSATYTGEAFIQGATAFGGGQSLDAGGVATLDADFTGTVNLTIGGLTGTSGNLPYDQLTILGMTIDPSARNTFSGGTLAISDGGTDITDDIIGTVSNFDAQGGFFGEDSSGNPDEAGGVFIAEGDSTGEVFGGFLTD